MMNMEKKYANEMGSFVMGLPEAKDLFSEVGKLSIVIIKGKPALRLKDKVHGWTTHFWKSIPGSLETTFCDMETAHYIAKELGFKPSDTTEVSMSLVGKKVMVKVYDTNTRPGGFTESDSIENALEMGFELGRNKNKYYLKKNEEYFEEGNVIEGEGKVIKKDFLQFAGLNHIVDSTDPDPVWLDQWEVRIKQITLSKVICCCTYMAGYSVFINKD